jgi:DNA-binding GntR family transcriptional regulator
MPELTNATLATRPVTTTTDQVFENLHSAIVALELPPGTKMSEADIARQFDISRQPVRDAFFRLSELGFLQIRPQRATLVSKISVDAVRQASFIRCALEMACLRDLVRLRTDADVAELDMLLARQKAVIDADEPRQFHDLDDLMHKRMCEMSGHGYVWNLIRDQKSHMDRVRRLSLPANAPRAYQDHIAIIETVRNQDLPAAEASLNEHLCRIFDMLDGIREANPDFFEPAAAA